MAGCCQLQAINETLSQPSINATISATAPSWLTVFQVFVQVGWG
jgi:hypothetical protein